VTPPRLGDWYDTSLLKRVVMPASASPLLYQLKPVVSPGSSARRSGVYWRPSRTVPKPPCSPTHAWPAQKVEPEVTVPVSGEKRCSMLKMPFNPPPRSSEPTTASREPAQTPLDTLTSLWPPFASSLSDSIATSMLPLRVMLVCAWATAGMAAASARARTVLFMVFPGVS
jgi:hypothetical protein